MNTENTFRTDANQKPQSKKIAIQSQGQLFKLHIPLEIFDRLGGGVRGQVSEFSAQSRKRMIETLARLNFARAGFVAFVTLTYPDRNGPPEHKEADRDRDTFQKRIKRRFPDTSAIWRREWEERQTGNFTGILFPHYHYLFFNLPFVHHSHIKTWWGEIIDYDGEDLRTEIKGIKSWRQALYYVSKYMTKVAEHAAPQAENGLKALPAGAIRRSQQLATDGSGGEGAPLSPLVNSERSFSADELEEIAEAFRHVNDIGKESESSTKTHTDRLSPPKGNAALPAAFPGGEAARDSSLVYVTYLTDTNTADGDALLKNSANENEKRNEENTVAAYRTGRHWGVFNRAKLPLADTETILLPSGKWLEAFRQKAGEAYAPAAEIEGCGFTLFVPDSKSWLDYAAKLEQEERA